MSRITPPRLPVQHKVPAVQAQGLPPGRAMSSAFGSVAASASIRSRRYPGSDWPRDRARSRRTAPGGEDGADHFLALPGGAGRAAPWRPRGRRVPAVPAGCRPSSRWPRPGLRPAGGGPAGEGPAGGRAGPGGDFPPTGDLLRGAGVRVVLGDDDQHLRGTASASSPTRAASRPSASIRSRIPGAQAG